MYVCVPISVKFNSQATVRKRSNDLPREPFAGFDLISFMEKSVEESNDWAIVNLWLVVEGGDAKPLATYFDPVWNVNVIIFHRRILRMIIMKFENWYNELREHGYFSKQSNDPSNFFSLHQLISRALQITI
mmetsp:Transcript_44150/g.50024  ORF Transcript_44150/g.50024 Transcript_44150/m.50024 type:complete len:131 (+) Transcript_44150:110-502(+)